MSGWISRGTIIRIALLAAVGGGSGFVAALLHEPSRPTREGGTVADAPVVRSVHGRLKVSIFGATAASSRTASAGTSHLHRFANGPFYAGMEDNDLRGYLDGTFKYAWNQPGQVHVRVGRRDTGPRYGEFELFRVLHRWDGIELPPGARVVRAVLSIGVEEADRDTVRVLIYEVRKDWVPGSGGVNRDNLSPPSKGEVWWNDSAFEIEAWSLPGVGFASDSDPRADTPTMPLAECVCPPGAERIVFDSPALSDYAAARISSGLPLLLLIKLDDFDEDTTGRLIQLYSGNHGDSRNISRRPELSIEWEAGGEVGGSTSPIHLEYGRSMTLQRVAMPRGGWIAASFESEDGSLRPAIDIRGGAGEVESAWERLARPIRRDWEWFEMRVWAAFDPIMLGDDFTAELKDTWIRTAPPEEQKVPWVFVSPSGVEHRVEARYEGDWRWSVRFHPEEIGPWRYSWSQSFAESPYESAVGRFDLIAGEYGGIVEGIDALAREIEAAGVDPSNEVQKGFMTRLQRLESATMRLMTPDRLASEEGKEMKARLARVRSLLQQAPPESIPMLPDSPPPWKRP